MFTTVKWGFPGPLPDVLLLFAMAHNVLDDDLLDLTEARVVHVDSFAMVVPERLGEKSLGALDFKRL